jgi:peptide/nickel transport system permease protein
MSDVILSSAGVEPELAAPPTAHRGWGHPLLWYVVRRVGAGIVTLFVVSVLVFAGTEALSGNAAEVVLGKGSTPAQVAKLEKEMGLDKPPVTRYLNWAGGLVHGDLGNTAIGYAQGEAVSVASRVDERLANSAILALVVFLVLVPLSLLLGVIAGVRAGKASDHAISLSTLGLISLPEFIVGSILILIFFTWLDVLPPVSLVAPGESPLANPDILVLPGLTLLGVTLGASVRMIRAGVSEAMRSDYVQMARLNGFGERKVLTRYALRNSLATSVQVFALNLQLLIGGIMITEYLFNYPGIGSELVAAVGVRDVTEVQSVVMIIAAFYVAVNIAADLIVVLLVPKLRTGGGK